MSHDVSENGWSPQGAVVELSDDASWDLLRTRTFGHLGVSIDGRPEIYPVDYQPVNRTILFRSGGGEKLTALRHNRFVAFEVDAETEDALWSVVINGVALALDTDPTLSTPVADAFPDWAPTEPFTYVSIEPESIRGRLFEKRLPRLGLYPPPEAVPADGPAPSP